MSAGDFVSRFHQRPARSTRDQPGVRYDVFKLAYGCYVDPITTAKAPLGLLPSDEEQPESPPRYLEMPPDDYRPIRRAILSLDRFYQSAAN